MSSNPLLVKPSSIVRLLGWTALLMVLASAGMQLAARLTGHENMYGLVPLFDLDGEKNIPTFFSMFLLLSADLLLWIVTLLKRKQKSPDGSYWALLSSGFLFMAADEASTIHELLGRPTHMLLGDENLSFFNYAWVIPGMALVGVLTLYFLRFLLRLPPKTRLAFFLAAIIYLGGAIGMEVVGGRIFEVHGRDLLYTLTSHVEESLEMTGVIIFIQALLVYIAETFEEVQIIFDPDSGQASPG